MDRDIWVMWGYHIRQIGLEKTLEEAIEHYSSLNQISCEDFENLPKTRKNHALEAVIIHTKNVKKSYSLRAEKKINHEKPVRTVIYNAGMMIVCRQVFI